MLVRRAFNWPTWNYSPSFPELSDPRRQMDRLYEGLSGASRTAGAGVFPLINVTEDKDAYRIRAELPGIKADELDITITGKSLAIADERKIAEETDGARYHRREREAGSFRRMVSLPGPVDAAKVEATCDSGILTVVLPKAEEAKPRQIAVK